MCAGVITVDTIALVDRYPAEDERVLANQLARSVGGPAAVAAITLARLGVPSGVIGTIGDDQDGRVVLETLAKEGVNAEGISISTSPTAGSVIVVAKEHRTRAIASRQQPTQEAPSQRALELAARAEWLHVDHVGIKQLKALGISRGHGTFISIDAGYDILDFDVTKVDLFAPNEHSLLSRNPNLSIEEAIEKEAKASGGIAVATQGGAGCIGYSAETGLISQPGFNVEVVSTLGAGDVFHGALLANLIQGRPLSEVMLRANAVASLKCRGLDGFSAVPNQSQLDAFLAGAK
jgi:sulfofructose kinase